MSQVSVTLFHVSVLSFQVIQSTVCTGVLQDHELVGFILHIIILLENNLIYLLYYLSR